VLALIFCVALPTDSDKDCDKNEFFHGRWELKVLTNSVYPPTRTSLKRVESHIGG
jgi:hypothetical protein